MIWLGGFAFVCFMLNFIAQFSFVCKNNLEAARAAGIEAAVWFTAAVICYK